MHAISIYYKRVSFNGYIYMRMRDDIGRPIRIYMYIYKYIYIYICVCTGLPIPSCCHQSQRVSPL